MILTKRIIALIWGIVKRHPDATLMMLVGCASAVASYVLHSMGL